MFKSEHELVQQNDELMKALKKVRKENEELMEFQDMEEVKELILEADKRLINELSNLENK